MTRRPGVVSEETKSRLLAAAKGEFARNGYSGTSLRAVCAAAGVTTGAAYFFFEGKDDLFEAVVSPTIEAILRAVRLHHDAELSAAVLPASDGRSAFEPFPDGTCDDLDAIEALVRMMYRDREAAAIIFANRGQECVAKFRDELVAILDEHLLRLVGSWDGALLEAPSLDPFMIHWFSHQELAIVATVVEHGLSEDDAVRRARHMASALTAAFCGMLAEAAAETGVGGGAVAALLPWEGRLRIEPPDAAGAGA